MIRAGVIGHPIAHSRSPKIHGFWLREHGIDGEYTAIDIAPDNLREGVDDLIHAGFAGFNVTLPHKQKIMALCADVDATAQAIGALNTVIIRNGKLYGSNTDAFGFMENLREHAGSLNFTTVRVLVLGAGGAARAVVYALQQASVPDIAIANRTREHAEKIAADFRGVRVLDWDDRSRSLGAIDLLINTTSLGMTGKDPLQIDLSALPKNAAVNDIVYAPLMTSLLIAARERGNPVITGIGMLLHQARPGFKAWFGRDVVVAPELERLVLT
jgi:shikimate dehydrogenase